MLEIDFERIHEIYSSAEEIKMQLDKNSGGFLFKIKIHRAHWYSDLAHDYIEAAFIGQQLTSFADRLEITEESDGLYGRDIKLLLKSNNTDSLAQLIFNFGQIYSGNNEEDSLKFVENLSEYLNKLEQIEHSFPELVDRYYVNYINGEYYEYDPVDNKDFFDNEFLRFPERKYGFLKSAFSKKLNQDFYASIDSVIIPNSSDIKLILKEYSGIENIDFIKAEFFVIGNISYLISNDFIVHFPFDSFIKAKHCTSEAFGMEKELYQEEGQWMSGFLSFSHLIAEINEKENFRGYPEDLSEELVKPVKEANKDLFLSSPVFCFYLSTYADYILVKDSCYSYFFFEPDKLTQNELGFLCNRISLLFDTTTKLAGIHAEIKCPWEQLNDEAFEELCFDIIYYSPKFDNSTIRKMGKSRSRDGKRDIVVYTHSRPGKIAQKYIFQCKYQQIGSSLSGSKVQDISDTITQFGASGYGIMTNVVIDSTLYDKLDGIKQNIKVEIEDYSVYRLERILSCYPKIKQRHFK